MNLESREVGFKFFPTCQVTVVRFYVSCPASSSASSFFSSAGPQLQALDRSVPRRARTANSGSECLPAGPQLQALDQSVPRRTRTASSGSECSPPDPNRKRWIAAFPAGPEQQAQEQRDHRCQIQCQNRCQIECEINSQNICQNNCMP